MILVCVIITLTLQFSALQHQVDSLTKTVKTEVLPLEHRLEGKTSGLQGQFRHLESEEHRLEKKEEKLEKKENQMDHELTDLEFKKDEPEHHHHALEPPHHTFNPFRGHHEFPMPSTNPIEALFSSIGDHFRTMRHTGPAEEFHMGPIIPLNNLFHPGAHPSQKPKDEEKKDEDKKDDHKAKNLDEKKKEEPKKDETKKEEPKKDDAKKDEHKEPVKAAKKIE